MKIASSDIMLASQHAAIKEETKTESLKFWTGSQRPDFEHAGQPAPLPAADKVDLSREARDGLHGAGKHRSAVAESGERDNDMETDPIARLIRMLTELLTGKKIKIKAMKPQEESVDPEKAAQLTQAASQAQAQTQTQPQGAGAGFGLEYDSVETYAEAERTDFSAQGIIRTADGQQIDFSLQLSMQRAFVSEKSTSIRLGNAVQQSDPLVINFEGTAAQLTNTKFSFDINADGSMDQVSFTQPGSGFIALDRNGDGRINDGSELFGTNSGNGFADLAAFDQDRNGWIDENDAVFNQLKVWSKDGEGNDILSGLKANGVGALYLGNTATSFELKTASNQSLGTVRTSGVYLNEDGSVGTLQQVDLTL